jgi:predicted acylesterase/phospholipase RssA
VGIIIRTTQGWEPVEKRVGLVLSGGGARGLAHLGVLSVLEEYRIPIDLVAGASFGSIVGGLYAFGYSSSRLLALTKDFFASAEDGTINRKVLWDRAEEAFKRELGIVQIEDAHLPLFILSVDLSEEDIRIFSHGSLFTAIRASSAFPGLFDPLFHEGHVYIDGGILNSMLLKIAHDNGADIILFSDVSYMGIVYRRKWINAILDALLYCVPGRFSRPLRHPNHMSEFKLIPRILPIVKRYKKECGHYRRDLADITIAPDLEGLRPLEFGKFDYAFRRGRDAALKQIAAIHRVLEPMPAEHGPTDAKSTMNQG